MLITFEPSLRFYFFKMLDRLELNFLLIGHLSTCLPVTTRQKSPRGGFAKNGSHWNYLYKFMQNHPQFYVDYNIELFAGMYLTP